MGTVILLRHGRSEANGSGVLAGRSADVGLDATGDEQVRALVERLADVPLAAAVSSPLLRCRQTLEPLVQSRGLEVSTDERLNEVDYGDWTGRALSELADEALWRVVQARPSAARFPGGEGLADVQTRALDAVRQYDARFTSEHGDAAVWLLCSHGDVLKSIVADALGQHLDSFQRIVVDPISISVVHYTELRPFVLRLNDNGGELATIVPKPSRAGEQGAEGSDQESDAAVGGSTGT